MRIVIIGGGVSGIAAARVLMHCRHEVLVLERGPSLGGVWAVAYPEVRLQNVAEHYRLADFPWPFPPDLHPTREQILRYLAAAVAHFRIDLRCSHEVLEARPTSAGWTLTVRSPAGTATETCDYLLLATGQYTGEQNRLALPGREHFMGQVLTDRDVTDLRVLGDRRVAIVGFGKSAVDMAAFAADRGSQVLHVFRTPRWLLPRVLFGVHAKNVLFARMSTVFMPSWVHPGRLERTLHERLGPLVDGFWGFLEMLIQAQSGLHGWHRDPQVRRRMRALQPENPLEYELRSASALAPDRYYPQVQVGRIEPIRGEPAGFVADGLRLADGRELACDLVVLSTGFGRLRFPFLPTEQRAVLEGDDDGPHLYRHLLHPRIPRLAFAGFNHGFLHVPTVELATLWLAAHLYGELALPPLDEMERCMAEVARWKREHVLFEPSRGVAVSTRFHQYLDVLCGDLGLRARRKAGPLAEAFVAYTAADYDGVLAEYEQARRGATGARQPLPLAT